MFTSSVNVAFFGTEIVDGKESDTTTTPSTMTHLDTYSSSKATAESIVLSAAAAAENDSFLKTCVLRLAGVYGPHEQIIVGRTFRSLLNGCDMFSCFPPKVRVDFVHIDNAVQAHLKANSGFLLCGLALNFYNSGLFFAHSKVQ